MHFRYGLIIIVVFGVLVLFGSTAEAIEHHRANGEPYRLQGQRLAFTTWSFVRVGRFEWQGGDELSVASGEPIVLRFRMNRSKIYALDFE